MKSGKRKKKRKEYPKTDSTQAHYFFSPLSSAHLHFHPARPTRSGHLRAVLPLACGPPQVWLIPSLRITYLWDHPVGRSPACPSSSSTTSPLLAGARLESRRPLTNPTRLPLPHKLRPPPLHSLLLLRRSRRPKPPSPIGKDIVRTACVVTAPLSPLSFEARIRWQSCRAQNVFNCAASFVGGRRRVNSSSGSAAAAVSPALADRARL
jgi:hypothetical protein